MQADAEKLLESAYEKWEEVKAFNDHNTLQEHLASLSTLIDHASEMVESSLYPSFHSSASTTNLLGEGSGQDYGSFATTASDIDLAVYNAVLQCNQAWPCSPSLFFEGLEFEPNAYEETAAADDGEPRTVDRRNNPPKIWRKLLCVAKWLSVRKRAVLTARSRELVGI